MKEWKNPELKELDVTNTKGDTLSGDDPDGEYIHFLWWKIPLYSSDGQCGGE